MPVRELAFDRAENGAVVHNIDGVFELPQTVVCGLKMYCGIGIRAQVSIEARSEEETEGHRRPEEAEDHQDKDSDASAPCWPATIRPQREVCFRYRERADTQDKVRPRILVCQRSTARDVSMRPSCRRERGT